MILVLVAAVVVCCKLYFGKTDAIWMFYLWFNWFMWYPNLSWFNWVKS